jgi:hypothetical protein
MYRMTLAEWQTKSKERSQLLYNCSEFIYQNDQWVPFPIGMSWGIINYRGPIQDIQVGPHNQQLLCAIITTTDEHRRPSGKNRKSIVETLRKKGVENHRIPNHHYLHSLPHFQFIISPEGNGIDCHRHYEALMAGCIPIVERNERLFEKYGNCPILYTDDYTEITQEYLDMKYKEMLDMTWDFSKLMLDTYNQETQEEIKKNGNFWSTKLTGIKWYS